MLGHVVLPIILDPARAHCCTGRRSFLGQPTRLCKREGRAGEGGGGVRHVNWDLVRCCDRVKDVLQVQCRIAPPSWTFGADLMAAIILL